MTQKGMIIGIAGPSASGKTTVAKLLAGQHGAYKTKYSDVLIEYVKGMRNPIPLDKRHLQELSTQLRREHGESYLTEQLRKKLLLVPNKMLIIEGNRRMVDMEFLVSLSEEEGKDLMLLYIDARPDVRWTRMNKRLQAEKKPSVRRPEFDLLEQDECENELRLVRDYIRTHGTVIDTSLLSPEEVTDKIRSLFPSQKAA